MLHDPSHYELPPIAEEIRLSQKDEDILRRLAGEVAAIAALPVQKDKARLWQKLNDRQSERPMVWINEICWHEMNVGGELTLQTHHPWAQSQEQELRRLLYQWRHMPGDMIVNDYLTCPLAIHSTDFGIIEEVDIVRMAAGVTKSAVQLNDPQRVRFEVDDGTAFELYHSQDCCESVVVESIVGDFADLVGTPILLAEEAQSDQTPGDAKD